MESINFDRIAERYDETRGGEARGTRLAEDIAPLLSADVPVIEVGVGTGVIALALHNLGFGIIGFDISFQMLARARDRIGATVVNADALHLPVRTESVDQAVSVWVLHVVADAGRVMSEVARMLRPGGRYLVMDGRVPEEDDDPFVPVWRELDEAFGRPEFTSRVRGWAQQAPAAGLRVSRIVQTGPYPVSSSAMQVADNIERRTHSWMWDIPEDLWQRVVPPIVARLRARPDAAEQVRIRAYQEILVLER